MRDAVFERVKSRLGRRETPDALREGGPWKRDGGGRRDEVGLDALDLEGAIAIMTDRGNKRDASPGRRNHFILQDSNRRINTV